MPVKLIGVDGSSSGSQINVGAAVKINASDFRGQAYQVQQSLLDAQYNEMQSMLQNEAATRKSVTQSYGASSGGGSSSGNKSGDVSEREKFEYTKAKDNRSDALNEAKFKEDVLRDRRDFSYKTQTEEQKSLGEQQYAAAQKEVEELNIKNQVALRSGGGMSMVRDGLNAILKKYPNITGDAQRDLIKQVYQPAQDVTKNYIQKTEEKTKEIQGYQRSTRLSEQRLALQGVLTNLNTATGQDRQNLMGTVQKRLNDIATSPDIDPLEAQFVISGLMQDIVESGKGGAELASLVSRYDKYSQDMSVLYGKRNSISPAQYDYEATRLATKFGIPSTNTSALKDPNFNDKQIAESLRTLQDVQALQKKGQLDQQLGMATSRGAIGSMAKRYSTPADVAMLKQYLANNGNPPAGAAIVKVAEGLIDFRQAYQDTTSKTNEIDKEVALLQSGTAQDVLRMLSGNREDVTSMLVFKSLAPDVQEMLSQGKALTPEQRDQFVSQYSILRQRAVEAAQREKGILATQLATKRQYLEIYVGKDQFAAYDAFKNNSQQQPQVRQQVGVSPNRSNQTQSPGQLVQDALGTLQNMGGK
jgi:hypothetical protein